MNRRTSSREGSALARAALGGLTGKRLAARLEEFGWDGRSRYWL